MLPEPNGGVAGPVTSSTVPASWEPPENQVWVPLGGVFATETSPGRTTTVLLAATPPAIDNAATTATAVPMNLVELLTV